MRMILLSALLGLGIGLAGTAGASAAPLGGLSTPVEMGSLVEQAQYYRRRVRHRVRCNTVRVCRVTPWGRRCHRERVCRRW